jgi:tetratricopeptide (TPR) repeat protein
MTDSRATNETAVFERYKEALRRGHVASMRGRLDAALLAYADAVSLAPERALPHVNLASTLLRMGRNEEALVAYGKALERAPRDAAALTGRADAFEALARPTEAADTLDVLADAHEAEGRLAEACDVARRALQLAESKTRRRVVERLVRALRDGPQSEAVGATLERAIAVLGVAPPAIEADAAPADGEGAPVDPGVALAEAEDSLGGPDEARTRELLIRAANAQRSAGHVDAAIDACYQALAVGPDDPELHVVLAELYVDRGWQVLAAEKLLLLGRLVELTGDTAARARLCGVVARSFADDPRLAAICI